jgi:hypothetical protein
VICSIRLNSSITAWVSQRCHKWRMVSAGGLPSAARPFGASCAIQFGQAAGLNQQRPGDGGDAFVGVEITVHKVSVDGANGGGRGAVGLVTAPQLASRAQFEHRPHIGQRFTLGQPHLSLVGVARGIHCGHAVLAHCR